MAYKFNPFTGKLDDYGPILTGTGTVSAAADGTAALPGIAFTSDLDTGIYRSGTNELAITTGGTGRVVIDSNGNINMDSNTLYVDAVNNKVGIGTSTVTHAMLHLTSPVSAAVIKSEDTAGTGSFLRILGDALSQNLINWKTGTSLRFASSDDNYGAFSERFRCDSAGRFLIGVTTDSGGSLLQVNGDRIRIGIAKTPASATDTGTAGEICWDANYIYVCTATNTWKRTAIATW